MRPAPATIISPEEEYFFRVNQELILKNRARLDAQRKAREKKQARELHWMKCPKCGDDLSPSPIGGITVDRCQGCEGIYFDKGELELLIHSKEHHSFIESLGEKLERSLTPTEDWQVPSH